MPICLRLFWHCRRAAASRTACTAGSSRPIRTAMMAMTTSNSMSVNAGRRSARSEAKGKDDALRMIFSPHNSSAGEVEPQTVVQVRSDFLTEDCLRVVPLRQRLLTGGVLLGNQHAVEAAVDARQVLSLDPQ